MVQTRTLTDYDSNAQSFDQFRQPSSIILEKLTKKFFGIDNPILSIGCGTGQYESNLSQTYSVFGFDRSNGMLDLAKERVQNVIQGDMVNLPFGCSKFDGVYFMQSLHHVGANINISMEKREDFRKKALAEAVRVLDRGQVIVVQRDPSQNQAVWFWKFFPKALEVKLTIQTGIRVIMEWLKSLDLENVNAEAIHDPMIRSFCEPDAPLDPGFRRSFSEFSYLSKGEIQIGLRRLKLAINDGSVINDIERCKLRFDEIGGTVFMISGVKF